MSQLISTRLVVNCVLQSRSLFSWVNTQFNEIDETRRKLYGADRSCAEWLLRNGAAVKWTNEKDFLRDYNKLPNENYRRYIQEVDASDSSIMDYGFKHFEGVQHCRKIILHNCAYLENNSLKRLSNIKELKTALLHLQISNCTGITEDGLVHLTNLTRLCSLVMLNLPSVKEEASLLATLKESLPKCKITLDQNNHNTSRLAALFL